MADDVRSPDGGVAWMTAFIDLPPGSFDTGVAFWSAVTASTVSDPRGEHGEFATLVPPSGDGCLRVQRVVDGDGGIHLDLHARDVPALVARAEQAGAQVVDAPGHVVLRSPAGLPFCVVAHHGEAVVPPPVAVQGDGPPSRVDQVCIDIPHDRYEDEVAFWAELTGWETRAALLEAFTRLVVPAALPLHLLLQRLGSDDRGQVGRAHFDVSCGTNAPRVARQHEALGAQVVAIHSHWIVMTAPTGHAYCLTVRDPATGAVTGPISPGAAV